MYCTARCDSDVQLFRLQRAGCARMRLLRFLHSRVLYCLLFSQVMDKLDDVRKKKIEEMVQEAIAAGKAAGGGGAAKAAPARPPSRTASGVAAAASAPGGTGSRPGTARSSPKALAPKNLNRLGSGAAAAAKAGAGGTAARRTATQGAGGMTTRSRAAAGGGSGIAAADEDLSVGKLSNEELEERMVQTFGGSTGELGWTCLPQGRQRVTLPLRMDHWGLSAASKQLRS